MGLRISRAVANRILRSGLVIDPGAPLILRDARAARELAASLRDEAAEGGETPESERVSAGRLRAAVELASFLRRRLEAYFAADPEAAERLLSGLERRLGRETVQRALAALARELQLAVAPSDQTDAAAGQLPADASRSALEELVLLYALSANPETASVSRALHGDSFGPDVPLDSLFEELGEELEAAPALDERGSCLRDSLLAAATSADSLPDQLRYVLDEWQELDGAERSGLLSGLDLISEENAPRFPPGPGPVEIPEYLDLEEESEYYSLDLHWMEPLVLIAKNSHVWLDQLSGRYGREIHRLDQIPDEELERLSRQGIGGLWLIGIWARSPASARIKRLMGNDQALASAYSVRDYRIAADLGGPEAAAELAERAGERGIRLAADMVPNHMGLDSKWLIDHPERFLSSEHCPFPSYTFDGPDLSPEPEVGIFLEDHYYDRTDAAVVFKRLDRRTGECRYVYHGNDGTSTPWNDTAQLDYLNPETREAVIATILRVAKAFPVIRFDAAMTLARRHVRRLWFPEPGAGGAIPSRSDHALSADDFERAMPTEFWREVVARVAHERPDTLLLAEAFWLMEGYFVRSLGMHRVYNSAFMHLLRDGETAKLRAMIEETLAFDPEILKRFVNFLSNPDEETAIEQFGAGDRYFGACTVLATLPGLPLFAHGQFEGLSEKYGMEFKRARLDERPDSAVEQRHRRQIQPLLRRRSQFAGVGGFRLLTMRASDEAAAGRVLAYANGAGTERSLVVFNNSAEPVIGSLSGIDGFLEADSDSVYRCRDLTTGKSHLCEAGPLGEQDLPVSLGPYETRVLVDFRPVLEAVQEQYRMVARRLSGRGARSLELELELLELVPLIEAGAAYAAACSAGRRVSAERRAVEAAAAALEPRYDRTLVRAGLARAEACRSLEKSVGRLPWPATERMQDARRRAIAQVARDGAGGSFLRALSTLEALRAVVGEPVDENVWQRAAEELLELVAPRAVGEEAGGARILPLAVESAWLTPAEPPGRAELRDLLKLWVERPDAGRLLGLNHYDGEDFVRREELETVLRWRGLTGLCGWLLSPESEGRDERALGWIEASELLLPLFANAGYAVGPVLDRLLKKPVARAGAGRGKARSKGGRARGRRRRRTNRSK